MIQHRVRVALACCLAASAVRGSHAQMSSPHYTKQAKVEHGPVNATVIANSPRPLSQIADAVSSEYGACINYEDPAYQRGPDLVDDTDLNWRAAHPNSPGVTRPAGTPFVASFPEDASLATSVAEQRAMLLTIVNRYNSSSEPGLFALYQESSGCFSIVGVGTRDHSVGRAVAPILDSVISIPEAGTSALNQLDSLTKELSKGGVRVFLAMAPLNLLARMHGEVPSKPQKARELVAAIVLESPVQLAWRLLYDADAKVYGLNLVRVVRSFEVGSR